MAIITRCRMPPENSCGYSLARCSRSAPGRGRAARWPASRASPRDVPRSQHQGLGRAGRPRCSTGLSAASGVLEHHRHLVAAHAPVLLRGSESRARSMPSKRTLPPDHPCPSSGSRPITASAVTDLPQPDSPTMARVSAGLDPGRTARRRRARCRRRCRNSTREVGDLDSSGAGAGALSRLAAASSARFRELGGSWRQPQVERVRRASAEHHQGQNGRRPADERNSSRCGVPRRPTAAVCSIMMPQVVDGGRTPMPRNDSTASVADHAGHSMSAAAPYTGAIALGSTCRNMMRRSGGPSACAAVT